MLLATLVAAVTSAIHPGDLIILVALTLFSDRILSFIQNFVNQTIRKLRKVEPKEYKYSRLQKLSQPLTRLGLVTSFIYLVDVGQIFLKGLGLFPPKLQLSSLTGELLELVRLVSLLAKTNSSLLVAIICYSLWSCQLFCEFKRKIILQNFRGPKGQALLYDRIADFGLSVVLIFFLMEVRNYEERSDEL